MNARAISLCTLFAGLVFTAGAQGFDFSDTSPEDLTKYDTHPGFDFSDMKPEDLAKYDKEAEKKATRGKVKISAKNFDFYFTDAVYKRRELALKLIGRLDVDTVRSFTPIEQLCREIEGEREFSFDDEWEFVGSTPKEIENLKKRYRAFKKYLAETTISRHLVLVMREFQASGFTRDIHTLDRVRNFIEDSGAFSLLSQFETFAREDLPRVIARERHQPFPREEDKARAIFLSQLRSPLVQQASPFALTAAHDNSLRALDEWLAKVTDAQLEKMKATRETVLRRIKKAQEALLVAGDEVAKLDGSPTVTKLFDLDKKILDAAQVQAEDQSARIKMFTDRSDELGQIMYPQAKFHHFSSRTEHACLDRRRHGPQYQTRARALMQRVEEVFQRIWSWNP